MKSKSSFRAGTSRLPRTSKLYKSDSSKWGEFRDAKAERDRDEEGLLYCQDYLLGLPRCNIGSPELDCHHIVGRESRPSLYFDESNLVWLTRDCHEKVHAHEN